MQQQIICTIFRPIKAHHLLLGEFLETVVSLGLGDLVDLASSPPVSQSSILGSPNQDCHPSSTSPRRSDSIEYGSQKSSGYEGPVSKKMRLSPSPSSNASLSQAVATSKSPSTSIPVNPSASEISDPNTSSHDKNSPNDGAPPQPIESSVVEVDPDVDAVEHLEQSMSVECGMKVCPECGEKIDRRIFKRHLQTHTEPDPFKCNLCGQEFSRLDNLQRHSTERCPRSYVPSFVLIRGCSHITSANFGGFQTSPPPLVSNRQQLPNSPSPPRQQSSTFA